MKKITIKSLISLIALWLTACTLSTNAAPAKTVESYLQALNAKDSAHLSNLSCANWESTALMELDSFQAVSTTLEGLTCQQIETQSDGSVVVNCTGKLIASYSGELQEFDLSARNYVVENSTGEWLVCGTK